MANWYVSSVKYALVSVWTANTAKTVGQIVRATSGFGGCYRVSTAGTTGATEPTWPGTKNGTVTNGTVTFTECTGQAAYNGDGGGTAWAAPGPAISYFINGTPTAWLAASDTIYVDSTHNNTSYGGGVNFTGTANTPFRLLSVDASAVPPTALLKGAREQSNSIAFSGNNNSFGYIYGVTFVASGGDINLHSASTSYNKCITLEECTLELSGTGSTSKIFLGAKNYISSTGAVKFNRFKNCKFLFGATGQRIAFEGGDIFIEGGSIAESGSIPSTLFNVVDGTSLGYSKVSLKGVDLSRCNGTLLAYGAGNIYQITLENCKTHSSLTPVSGTNQGPYSASLRINSSEGTNHNYGFYFNDYNGTLTDETTIVRTGGATDGTTPVSLKIVTTTNCRQLTPFIPYVLETWNDVVGSALTATVEFATSATWNNSHVWMEIEYYGNSSFPITSFVSSGVNILGTSTDYPSSSESWGGSIASKQKMSLTFTPQMKGLIRAKLFVGRNSGTIYIDPVMTVA